MLPGSSRNFTTGHSNLYYNRLCLKRKEAQNKGIQKKRDQLQEFISRFRAKASTASRAQSKMKQLERLKIIEIGHELSTVRIPIPQVERRAALDATLEAGAARAYLIDEPLAAAIGAKIPIAASHGHMILDIGGGAAEAAVISLGGVVIAKSLRVAGDKLNEDIIHFAQEEFKLLIGEQTAEEIKIAIGSVYPQKDKRQAPLRGRNLVTGLPEEIMVTDEDVRHAMEKSVRQIVNTIKTTIEETPPELLADIMEDGIWLSGGGSQLRGLDTLLIKEIKIKARVVEDPMTAVARGAGMVLENLDELAEVLIETEGLEPLS